MPARPLIWPLLDRFNPPVAFQRRPKSNAGLALTRLPVLPWDTIRATAGAAGYGNVEGDPTLAEFRPWNFGLGQSKRLEDFKSNPRAHPLSEQRHVPAAVHFLPLSQFLPPAAPPNDSRQASRIIWPLMARLFFNPSRVVTSSPVNTNLRAAVPGVVALQQNPIAASQRAPLRPWARMPRPSVVHVNPPSRVVTITGITRDSAGAVLGGCAVELYDTITNLPMMQTISDATTGIYTFTCAKLPPGQHYLVAYKIGAPDRSGTTLNTVVGV
jgi:hypothetical protein